MPAIPSDAFVFFGATGDLAYKQIFPALQAMIRHGRLEIPVIGIANDGWTVEQLRERARSSLLNHGNFDAAAFDKLCSLMKNVNGDYRNESTFSELKKALGGAKRPLHYLAIPPSMFATVAEGLAKSGCVNDSRIIVEKPFGRDLASARQLNATLHRFFSEESIFRIDHYLGKEPVLNLIYFRFANPWIEDIWNNRHIESVQITMAENFGVEGRGKMYEEVGAIRDVVQNHMLRVIACLALDCPSGNNHECQGVARTRLLQHVRKLSPDDLVRGQFRGYRQESGVKPDSNVETFAAVRFWIDNERWKGVPFYVRAGKHLPITATEILVRSKPAVRPVLDEPGPPVSNYYRFRLSPEMILAMGTRVKKPGEAMTGNAVELVAHYVPPDEMRPYERLLGDGLNGDATLFASADDIEASWEVVDSVLNNVTPLYEYDANSWGPPEVAGRIEPEGGWHNPEPNAGTTAL